MGICQIQILEGKVDLSGDPCLHDLLLGPGLVRTVAPPVPRCQVGVEVEGRRAVA